MAEKNHRNKRPRHRATTATDAAEDRISNLPYPILHQILALLPFIEVIRTCVLSKTFLAVFNTFPVIDLDFLQFERSIHVLWLPDKMAEFIEYVNRSVHQRRQLDTSFQKFGIRANIKEARQAGEIRRHIDFVISRRVQELAIDLEFPRYSLTRTITTAIWIKVVNLAGLKLVRLSQLNLNSCWPVLESLSISRCTGFKDFNFSSKIIKSITLESCTGLKTIKIASSSLTTLIYFGTSKPCTINITECRFIKALSLGYASIGENWLEENVPRFLHLEDLGLIKLSPKLHELKVSSRSVKRIEVVFTSYGTVVIHAPELESLETAGGAVFLHPTCPPLQRLSWQSDIVRNDIFRKQLSDVRDMNGLEMVFNRACLLTRFEIHRQKGFRFLPAEDKVLKLKLEVPELVCFKFRYYNLLEYVVPSEVPLDVTVSINSNIALDNQDFARLWDWIASFGRVKALTLVWTSFQDLFCLEHDGDDILTPMYDLKSLTIKLLAWRTISPELVNSFLWKSPNLETMHFVSSVGLKKSIEFVYASRDWATDDLPCCRRLFIKCWRHCMRKVMLKNFDDVERQQFQKYFTQNALLLQKFRY